MLRNDDFYGTELIRGLQADLGQRLPKDWSIAAILSGVPPFSATFCLHAPDGTNGELYFVTRNVFEPRHVVEVERAIRHSARPDADVVIVAPFVGPEARARLASAGLGYADATGNLRIALKKPAVYIQDNGAEKNPWREKRSLGSLRGPAAGDVVRALCDFRPPYGIRELVSRANLSLGTVARVVDHLARDATLERDERGLITRVDVPATIQRWARDYACLKANRARLYLEPRGVSALLSKLASLEAPVAVTGSLAAAALAPIAAPRLVTLYASDAAAVAEALEIRPVESGGNVLLVEPRSPIVFARTRQVGGVTYAAPSQVVADLLTAPGRGPEEAEALLSWMEANEDAWRS